MFEQKLHTKLPHLLQVCVVLNFLASLHISYGSFDCIVVASMLVLERIEFEVIVKKMSVEAFIFDNVVF